MRATRDEVRRDGAAPRPACGAGFRELVDWARGPGPPAGRALVGLPHGHRRRCWRTGASTASTWRATTPASPLEGCTPPVGRPRRALRAVRAAAASATTCAARAGSERVVYVGDGISDRCVAEIADLVFARADLATLPGGRGRPLPALRGLRRGAGAPRGPLHPGRLMRLAGGPPGRGLGRDGGARARLLARARRLPAQHVPARGRHAVRLLRGPADGQRAPRRRTTCSRACSRTSSPASRPCAAASSTGAAAGTATACRWRSRWRSASASRASPRSRPTASPSSTPSAASRWSPTSTSGSASPSGSASGSTPTGPTARWTRTTSRASGGASPSSTGATWCTAATRSCPTARAAARRCPATRSPWATWTSRTPRSTCASRSGDAPGESLLVWTTTPWTLPANQAAAINPDVTYAAVEHGDETLILAEPLVREVLGEDARVLAHHGRRRAARARVRAAVPLPAEGAHRVVEAGFVTTERRHRHRPHRPGLRRGRHGHGAPPRAGRPQPGGPGRALLRGGRRRGPAAR